MKAILDVENKAPKEVSDFGAIEKSLRALKSYGSQSFAIVTRPDGSYIQVAGGRLTCVLEMRSQSDQKHYRAHYDVPKVPFEGPQVLVFGGGQITVNPDEILFIDDVVNAFRAFLGLATYPDNIVWRDVTEIMNSTQ